MLIESARYSTRDLEVWRARERADAVHAQTLAFRRRFERSISALVEFAAAGLCYAGTSWGKDSTVLAHLIATHTPHVPLVHVHVDGVHNPDCDRVRDAFLADHPAVSYEEIRAGVGGKLTSGAGFAEAARRFGDRHVSGVRAGESRTRALRMARWGESTERTSAPIGWWTGADVFAYLHVHRLPVHPAYACSLGGAIDRERLRVAALGGERGRGHGRSEWERRYYGDVTG